MIDRENTRGSPVPLRTIIVAITMLTGIVLLGFGYFQDKLLMIYAGVAITLSGVMTEAIIGILGRARRQRGGRITGA
jgi:hypothetical protein